MIAGTSQSNFAEKLSLAGRAWVGSALKTVFGLFLVLIASNAAFADAQQQNGVLDSPRRDDPKLIRLVSGQPGTTSYAFGVAVETLFHLKRNRPPFIALNTQAAENSVDALEALAKGDVQLAIVESDVVRRAFQNDAETEGSGRFDKLRLVTRLWREPVHIIVRDHHARSGTISDLARIDPRTVSTGARSSFLHEEVPHMLQALGLTQNEGKDYSLNYRPSEALAALTDKKVQALVMPGGLPLYTAEAAMRLEGLPTSFLNVSVSQAELINGLTQNRWQPYTIPANTYSNQPSPIETIAQEMVLVTSNDVPDYLVYEVLERFFHNIAFFGALLPIANDISARSATSNPPIPLHVGALRFSKKHGNSESFWSWIFE